MIRGIAILGLVLFLVAGLFLLGTYVLESAQCYALQKEYPDRHWRVTIFGCSTLMNGNWMSDDVFLQIGKD